MKAVIKKSGLEVFIREDITTKHTLNSGKVAVSKQPEGMSYFCVNKEDLEINHSKKYGS